MHNRATRGQKRECAIDRVRNTQILTFRLAITALTVLAGTLVQENWIISFGPKHSLALLASAHSHQSMMHRRFWLAPWQPPKGYHADLF
jgi:hypothetical protein